MSAPITVSVKDENFAGKVLQEVMVCFSNGSYRVYYMTPDGSCN